MDFYDRKENDMESIAPPLKLLLSVKKALEKGQSTRQGLLIYLKSDQDHFSEKVTKWYALFQQGLSTSEIIRQISSPHRRILLQLLQRGLAGESIYNPLCQLEIEIVEACHEEIACKMAQLPLVLLVPLLLLQFPAILMLLFGPLLQNFFHSFAGQ